MYYFNLTNSQKETIRKELSNDNENGIFIKLLKDLKNTFRPEDTSNPEMFDDSKHFEVDSDGLTRLAMALKPYEEDGRYRDRYRLRDENGVVYFDFFKDVFDVAHEIGYILMQHNHYLWFRFSTIRYTLGKSRDYFLYHMDHDNYYYYYHKDQYGTEACYPVTEDLLRSDMLGTLHRLTSDAVPVEIITEVEAENDEDNEFMKARKEAIHNAVDEGFTFPMILITHATDDLKNKYECVQKTEDAEYIELLMELIHEYAQSKDFKIEPTYISADSITAKAAERQGMYFLAKTIEEKED